MIESVLNLDNTYQLLKNLNKRCCLRMFLRVKEDISFSSLGRSFQILEDLNPKDLCPAADYK